MGARRGDSRGCAATVIGLSLLGHVVVLAFLALGRPSTPPVFTDRPAEIQLRVMRARPPRGQSGAPTPVTRASPAFAPAMPSASQAGPSAPPAPPELVAADPREALRAALRRSVIACANARAVDLGPEEREACDARLAAGATEAAYIEAPISASKRATFDRIAAALAKRRRGREAPMPPGIDPRANGGGGAPVGLGAD